MTETVVSTPVGFLSLREEDGAVVEVRWGAATRTGDSGSPVLTRARRWIEDYFSGRFRPVDFPLHPGGTPFQRKVWRVLTHIAPGKTASYGDVANTLGTSPRAVGNACAANPLPLVVPCHRILAGGGGLGGYSGGHGLSTKRALLDHEHSR